MSLDTYMRIHAGPVRRRSARVWLGALMLFAVAFGLTASHCQLQRTRPMGYGLLHFAGDEHSRALDSQLALGINPLLDWAQLEPQEGVYNWSHVDALLAAAHAKGKRVALRIYTNKGEFGQATPDWVFGAGAQAYASEPGSARQPVPTDPVFAEKFGAFLTAFGSRYDGYPDIEFVQTNAGMGTFGEMVWGFPDEYRPPGWSDDRQVRTSEYWIDRWHAAFPTTPLVLMENAIGFGIVEEVAAYAVKRGFYLQANDPQHPEHSQGILAKYADDTKIILEIEDGGCRSSTGAAFDDTLSRVFEPGFPIDYLMICQETLEDGGRAQAAQERLRRDELR
ncbi:MAG: beta-galactosidase [Dehalococcoidia bacterium]